MVSYNDKSNEKCESTEHSGKLKGHMPKACLNEAFEPCMRKRSYCKPQWGSHLNASNTIKGIEIKNISITFVMC